MSEEMNQTNLKDDVTVDSTNQEVQSPYTAPKLGTNMDAYQAQPMGQPMMQPMGQPMMQPMGQPMMQPNAPYMARPEFINTPMKKLADGPSLLQCVALGKSYIKGRPILQNFNLRIEKGHIVGLLGPNGSGKTTLIKMINGLLTPTEGEVLINGTKPGAASKAIGLLNMMRYSSESSDFR